MKKKQLKSDFSKMPDEFKNEFKKLLKTLSPEIDPQEVDTVLEGFVESLGSDKAPAEVVGMDEQLLDQYYQFAYDHYNSGKYNDAQLLFQFLISLDSSAGRNWLGLGASYQQLGEYQLAIDNYMTLTLMEPENPLPYYYCSDCYMNLDEPIIAAMMLEETVNRCGEDKNLEMLKIRAQASMEKLVADEGFEFPKEAKKSA